ncbi:MAG: hypothetical protein WCT49_04815 [Candidatus Paceibacterota bacterium]|jgi:hypothetical protein|nr:hypothetical protein [Candidatus Paceibacterota bacterium]
MEKNEPQNTNIFPKQTKSENFVAENELHKVLSLPKEERKDALTEFKKQLADQEKAWAMCRNAIEGEIVKNPDTPREKLISIIDTFSESYGFGKTERDIAERLIDSYYRYRENMKEVYVHSGGDAHALAEELTGSDCKQSSFLEMKPGLMSVDFLADNLTARRMRGEKEPDPNDRIILAGFKEITKGEKPVMYTVVVVPADNIERTQIHENEHVTNQLFQEEFDGMNSSLEIASLWEEYCNKTSENEEKKEEKTVCLRKYLLAEEKLALEKSKDEIIAHKKSGDERNVTYILLEPKKEGGLYDYFSESEERMKNDSDENMIEPWKKLWQDIVISEYPRVVEEGEQAFNRIAASHSAEFAVALLSNVSLRKWPKR